MEQGCRIEYISTEELASQYKVECQLDADPAKHSKSMTRLPATLKDKVFNSTWDSPGSVSGAIVKEGKVLLGNPLNWGSYSAKG